jgi:hypothetical protein
MKGDDGALRVLRYTMQEDVSKIRLHAKKLSHQGETNFT